MNANLKPLVKKLERMELEHLRQHALKLTEKLEQSEEDALRANESAEFWHGYAMELQEAVGNEEHATARCIGVNKEGELLVVRMDAQ